MQFFVNMFSITNVSGHLCKLKVITRGLVCIIFFLWKLRNLILTFLDILFVRENTCSSIALWEIENLWGTQEISVLNSWEKDECWDRENFDSVLWIFHMVNVTFLAYVGWTERLYTRTRFGDQKRLYVSTRFELQEDFYAS